MTTRLVRMIIYNARLSSGKDFCVEPALKLIDAKYIFVVGLYLKIIMHDRITEPDM